MMDNITKKQKYKKIFKLLNKASVLLDQAYAAHMEKRLKKQGEHDERIAS